MKVLICFYVSITKSVLRLMFTNSQFSLIQCCMIHSESQSTTQCDLSYIMIAEIRVKQAGLTSCVLNIAEDLVHLLLLS